MIPPRSKYIREERNGKIVYVPSSEPGKGTSKKRQLPSSYNLSLEPAHRLIRALGWSFNVWFPPIAWIGAATFTVGLGWFAWQGITNPDVVFWVNQFTPGNLNRKIPADDQPKTLPEILAQLERYEKKAGTPMPLNSGFRFQDDLEGATFIAIPILSHRPEDGCSRRCEFIQELQIYRTLDLPPLIQLLQRKRRFRSVNRMPLFGPSDQDLNQLIRTVKRRGSGEGSSRPLGMTLLEQKILENDANIWLTLSGLRAKGNATAAYGQILHFSPARSQLSVMLNWISPSGQVPAWEDITGDGRPDIVIDQSIGLEPSFAAYEMKRSPNGSPWLTLVDLNKPALKLSSYQGALQLARSGLWTQAQEKLTVIKGQQGDQWSASAQAQFGLIQRHASVLKPNSTLAFSDPIEEIQSLLVQGSWAIAKQKLLASRNNIPSILRILAADNGQIGDRIQASAQVGPQPKAAIEWGIIYAYAKGGKAQATKWTKSHHPTSEKLIAPLIQTLTEPPKSKEKKAVQSEGSDPTQPVKPSSQKPETL